MCHKKENGGTVGRLLRIAVTAILAIGLHARASSADAILSISPPSTPPSVGDVVSLDVNIDNVTDLYAFQFTVDFDPSILQATTTTEGSFLASGGPTVFIPGAIDDVSGTITFLADTLEGQIPGVSGSGTLAILQFDAVAAGTSPVSVVLDPLNGDTLLDSSLSPIAASTNGGISVSVQPASPTPVPEPGTLTLIGAGGLALLVRRRRACPVPD